MKSKNELRVCILSGGISKEREVSIVTGRYVYESLKRLGYKCKLVDPKEWIGKKRIDLGGFDIVFNALHGTYGEDGRIQGLLDCLGIPYTGSDCQASAISMNKHITKTILKRSGIPTPDWTVVETDDSGKLNLPASINFPFVIKPIDEGSSVDVFIVKDKKMLEAIKRLLPKRKYIFEEYIEGRELTAAVFDNRAIGACEIVVEDEFYDYTAKYKSDKTRYIIPPEIENSLLEDILKIAENTHHLLGLSFYSRTDFRLSKDGIPYVLEINSLPGLTDHSLLPKICEQAGIEYDQMIEKILFGALET